MLNPAHLHEIVEPLPLITEQPKVFERVWPIADAYERLGFPVHYGWVDFDSDNTFQMGESEPALIFPLFIDGDIADLAAVSLKRQHSATMQDLFMCIGQWNYERLVGEWMTEADQNYEIDIWSSCGRWLRSGGRGVYIQDVAFYRHLAHSPWLTLKCEDAELAKKVEARIMDSLAVAPVITTM